MMNDTLSHGPARWTRTRLSASEDYAYLCYRDNRLIATVYRYLPGGVFCIDGNPKKLYRTLKSAKLAAEQQG